MSKKKRADPRDSRSRRSPVSPDAMRSMIRLVLSVRVAEGGTAAQAEARIRSAMEAFGHVVKLDAWIVGTLSIAPASSARFDQLFAGGADAKVVGVIRKRWIEQIGREPKQMQAILSVVARRSLPPMPRVRLWNDAAERAMLSIWHKPDASRTDPASSTWISLHRVGAEAARFATRDRKHLKLLHEQCAEVLN